MNIKGTSKLEKISSNYILINIFDYIQDTFFKFKLFVHSKLYQKNVILLMMIIKIYIFLL